MSLRLTTEAVGDCFDRYNEDMKRGVFFLLSLLVLMGALFFNSKNLVVRADDIADLQRQIDELENLKKQSEEATEPLEEELKSLDQRIQNARASIAIAKQQIQDREKDVAIQYTLLSGRVAQQYKRSRTFSLLLLLFQSTSASDLTKNLAYGSSIQAQDNQMIRGFTEEIVQLEKDQATLAALEEQLESQASFFAGEIEKARSYQEQLKGQIASLTARQNEIIAARSGGFAASIGDSELADDYNASIKGFRESAPSGYFAVFSFGGYSHRKGMSQYGARGRAENGETYKSILSKYYGKEPVKKDTSGSIKVAGQGEMDFEGKYLMGIAEMPSTWHPEALKAQAVAARTYAYRYKVEGREICITQSCQVYNSGKAENPPAEWKQAVETTKGEILEDVVTYYSSTSGGWLKTSGWDTTDGGGGGSFIDKAYENKGGSPWLVKAWYTQGYSVNSDKCGRSNPWLSPQEMADIINAAIALKTPGIDTTRITPVTTSCWGGNPYSMDELKNLVSSHGGISSATSVSVSQGDGKTNSITINGINVNPSEFREAFNLRAPGYLSIPQSQGVYGDPFFNVEKK